MEDLKNTFNQWNLNDMYFKTPPNNSTICIHFKCTWHVLQFDHTVRHKTSLKKLRRDNHNRNELDMSNRNIPRKILRYLELN